MGAGRTTARRRLLATAWVALASVATVAGLHTVVVGGPTPTDSPGAVPAPAAVRFDRGEATDRRHGRSRRGGRHRESGSRRPRPALARPQTRSRRSVRFDRAGWSAEHRAAGLRCHDRRPAVPRSGHCGVRPLRRGVEHGRVRANPARRHPAPPVAASACGGAPTGPVPCTNAMTAAGARSTPPSTRSVSHPSSASSSRTRAPSRACATSTPPGRRSSCGAATARPGSGRATTAATARPRPAHADPRPARRVRRDLGGPHLDPGLRPARTVVPAGTYRVMARLDDDISAPTPFQRTPGRA